MSHVEVWLRGPIDGVAPMLQPLVHAFLQAAEDVERLVTGLGEADVWREPGGAASAGFHCRHLAGSTDRLLAYARGEALSEAQIAEMKREKQAGDPPETAASLVERVHASMTRAVAQIRGTDTGQLATPREVGRARLPSTVIGLLFHAAEHATRHAGQLATTVKIVRGQKD